MSASRHLTEKQEAIVRLWKGGATLSEIGRHFGVTRERIRQILKTLKSQGVHIASRVDRTATRRRQRLEGILIAFQDQIIDRLRKGETATQISTSLELGQVDCRDAIRRLIADGKTVGPRYLPSETTKVTWQQISRHLEEGLSLIEIANVLSISKASVSAHIRLMRENGILPPRLHGPQPNFLLDRKRESIVRDMLSRGAKRIEIAAKLGIGIRTLARLLAHMRSYK